MTKVYVVTNPELGWDCVVGVFNSDSVSMSTLKETFPEYYCIHSKLVEKDVFDYRELEE